MERHHRLAAATLIAAVAAGCGGGDDPTLTPSPTEATTSSAQTEQEPTAAPPTPTAGADVVAITVSDGEPEGGIARPEFDLGDEVRLEVTSTDTTDHLHVHGYDLFADLSPGETAVIEFVAEIPGQFEVELEDSHTKIAELVVSG